MRIDLTRARSLLRDLRNRLGLGIFGATLLPFVVRALENRDDWTLLLAKAYVQGVPAEQLLQQITRAWETSLFTVADDAPETMH